MKCSLCFFTCVFLLVNNNLHGQVKDYHYVFVNKKISELIFDSINLDTPLLAYISFQNILIKGKIGQIRSVSSENLWCRQPQSNTPDYVLNGIKKEDILNYKIKEIVIYKDSIAALITSYGVNTQVLGYMMCIDNKWYYNGEDIVFSNDLSQAHELFKSKVNYKINILRRIYSIRKYPSDTTLYTTWMQTHSVSPQKRMLRLLSNYKLVMYGETHKKKQSWKFLKSLIRNPSFAQNTQAICLELPSYTQPLLDSFYTNDKIKKEIVLNILHSEQIYGWEDRGMYEFIIDLWYLNKRLPYSEKIKVFAVDFQMPFDSINSSLEYNDYIKNQMQDRDHHMASLVQKIVIELPLNKSCLFIAGLNHTRKFSPEGSTIKAGTYLAHKFSSECVSVCVHTARITNTGEFFGEVRHGFWDYIFKLNKNKPIAIPLDNSPFGAEPFDCIPEIAYHVDCGSYKDMYDEYLYLGPLTNSTYRLYRKFFTHSFIEKLKKRAEISQNQYGWYQIPVEDLSPKNIIKVLKRANKNN